MEEHPPLVFNLALKANKDRVTEQLALQWLPCQAPYIIGSALGQVGPVSVYCDWVRKKVGSASSVCVAARTFVCADLSLRYTSLLLGR